MGNTASGCKSGYRPLAISAVARQLDLKKAQLIFLREAYAEIASYDEMITHKQFKFGLKKARFSKREDLEIINLLFTMWDRHGDNEVPYREFIMGIAPLACPDQSLESILRFSLQISDDDRRATITDVELSELLHSIDNTASFFGDPTLRRRGVRQVVEAVFSKGEAEIAHEVCVRRLVRNPLIKRFAMGTVDNPRVKFKEEVEEIETETGLEVTMTDSLSSLLHSSVSLSSSESDVTNSDTVSALSSSIYSGSTNDSLRATMMKNPPESPYNDLRPTMMIDARHAGNDQIFQETMRGILISNPQPHHTEFVSTLVNRRQLI